MTDLTGRRGFAKTGDLFPEKEGLAASLFSGILLEEGLAVPNTFKGGEATFSSTRGTLTRSDDIAAPAGNATAIGPVPGTGQNWNPIAGSKEHPQA